jgi:hypothetical protein
MPSRLKTTIELLHGVSEIGLATQSLGSPGFPYATTVSFIADEHHEPVLLLSRLAEHTQNLLADPHASVVVAQSLGGGEIARASLLGLIEPIGRPTALVTRYLRYHPAAERLLALGDFELYRMTIQRIRVVGGFAQAGWLEGNAFAEAPYFTLQQEAQLLETLADNIPPDLTLLGIDAFGVDLMAAGQCQRRAFKSGPVVLEAADAAVRRTLKG